MKVNTRIKAARISSGLTQVDAALKFGVTQSAWSKIENGMLEPGVKLLQDLKAKLGVSYTYLLDGIPATENDIKASKIPVSQAVSKRIKT